MSSLRRQLLWYIILRLVVIFSIAAVFGLFYLAGGGGTTPEEPLRFLVLLTGFTGAATLVHLTLFRFLSERLAVQAYVQFFGDLALITYLIFRFGVDNPFSPLYLVVIITASAILGQRAGILVASVSYLLYAGFQVSLTFESLPWLPVAHVPQQWGDLFFIYRLLIHLVGFLATALLSAQLRMRAREAEHALAEQSEDLADLRVVYQDVVESIPSGICTTDVAGRITMLNRTGRQILELADQDLFGRPIHEPLLFTEEQWGEMTLSTTHSGLRLRSELSLERNGERIFIGFTISRLTDSDGDHQGYIVIFQDLTQWRKLEEEVRLKDRMAAVGELAAGLAHEIGNPLAAISGSVQMLSGSTSASVSDRKLLAILFKESQRLDRTIKGFLRFARPRERSSVHFDIAALLAENVELLSNSPELSEDHEVVLHLEPTTATLTGDPDQITQIFWNLARNALKAMPEGGRLTLHGRIAGDVYRLSFTDTGRGMTDEERANLFHPFQSFFDTGTGIGMAIVYRIVEEHGGNLSVESAPGRGSTITVELPAARNLSEVAM